MVSSSFGWVQDWTHVNMIMNHSIVQKVANFRPDYWALIISNGYALEFLTLYNRMINSSKQWLFLWAQWRLKGVCPLRASSTGPCLVRQLMGDTVYMVKSHMFANQALSSMEILC